MLFVIGLAAVAVNVMCNDRQEDLLIPEEGTDYVPAFSRDMVK